MRAALAWCVDGAMCNMMHALQWRRRRDASRPADLMAYRKSCFGQSRTDYLSLVDGGPEGSVREFLEWKSPRSSGHPENDRARAWIMPGARKNAPAVFVLHALMSASDAGYRRLAARWNARGWTVVFTHLPFHYSRTPHGTWNGELAITAHLVRNAEGIRQAVMEMRQLMAWLRGNGTREFGLVGTSYGGWTGALLASVEADWRFVGLVQPIVNMDKAVWENPGAAVMRRELRRLGHSRGGTEWFDRLGSPLHGPLACEAGRIVVTAGLHDRVSPLADLEAAAAVWGGCELLLANQGHFGYTALRETVRHIEHRGWV